MILGTSRAVRVFAYPEPVDLRKGYDGLYGLVKCRLARDPLSGDLFLFSNKRRHAFVTDEIARRDSAAAHNRATEAGLHLDMTLERWDKTSKVSFDKRLLAELASLRFLEAHRHVVVLGPVGVGKTFLASALGHVACRHGYHVRFVRADEALRTLRQSRLDNSREAVMTEFVTVDLLILDDFALDTMTKEASKHVYQLFLERTGRASMIVTSNRDTAEWLAMFDDVLLAQSAVDRFKNAAFDFVIEGESYRPRLKPKLETDDPPPSAPVPKPRPHPRSRLRRR